LIGKLPASFKFSPTDIYRFLRADHLELTKTRGDAEREPRYMNDARQAINDAKNHGLVRWVSRAKWERTDAPVPSRTPDDLELTDLSELDEIG
jgi:hypothetical protein